MEFYNCVVFIRETSTDSSVPHREFTDNNWHFYALGNVGDSKKTDYTRVNNANDPLEHVIEIADVDKPLASFPTGKAGHAICSESEWTAGNGAYDVLHSTEYVYDDEGEFESFGGETYEFRYEMEDITAEQREVNINTWRELYRFIVTSSDEEFHAHLKDYFVVDSALYYYLFTERYTMVDNRAKNSFWHYGKVYISHAEAEVLGEEEASYYIIDDEAAAIRNGYRYDLTFFYDADTCLGIDNTGDFVFPYGKEDTDYYVDGDPSSDYVFRAADSVFFCRLRDLFPVEMQAMFKDREEKGAWLSQSLIDQWDDSQAQFSEELWRLDYERKYYRTYKGISIDNSIPKLDKTFLIGKFFGRKKYARRSFETNNDMYFATKYFGNKALEDVFWIRGNVPIGSSLTPNYSLTLVPYSDMYVCVQYGSTGTPIHQKVKAGQTCYFESTADRMDFIYVYAASYIQEVGDLSRCYIGDNSFSAATRLQKLVIGSTVDGYENTFMKEVLVENNPLLEYLDLRNVSGINTEIDVSSCSNLKELYAEGTNASGVLFANGGLLEVAHLPKIASLSMKNMNFVREFIVDDYENMQTLVVENVPAINTYEIVQSAPLLRLVRLVGMDWNSSYRIEDSSVFNRLLTIDGIDSSGHETDMSVLIGTAFVPVLYQQEANDYQDAWPDLVISCDTLVEQYVVTFVNDDGTVLKTQYVVKGEIPGDPGIIPEKEPSVSHAYTFDSWDVDPATTQVFADKTFTATYTSALREYAVRYVSMNTVLQERTATYGSSVLYEGEIPVYTAQESAYAYYLFNRWDKSGYVDGDKTITAVFDKYEYDGNLANIDFEDMTPVQIYALTKLYKQGTLSLPSEGHIEVGSSTLVSLGNDIDYDDIEQTVLIDTPMHFDGSNAYDTGVSIFDKDRDFVLAVDYMFSSNCSTGGVLMQCLQPIALQGVRLFYNENPRITWNQNTNTSLSPAERREILILRHTAGSDILKVYNSNVTGEISLIELSAVSAMGTFANTLVFGAAKAADGVFQNYAIGDVYWAKLWYADLGDAACRELAAWVHEDVRMEIGSFRSYTLANDMTQTCSMSLLASNVLSVDTPWSDTGTTGGFANSKLREVMNSRVYKAIPMQIRSILKSVLVPSTVGDNKSEITSSACYVYAPAYVEVYKTSTEPYVNEGSTIPYMVDDKSRMKMDTTGSYRRWWTRSPKIYGSGSLDYVWGFSETGAVLSTSYSYAASSVRNYMLIQFSI